MNVECIILAAGFSSRAAVNKMLLKLNGKTVIEHCVNAFYEDCSRIIVVTGHYHDDVKNVLNGYKKVCIKFNDNYKNGMFSSVKTGLTEICADRFFLTPGDYPLLKRKTINYMLKTDKNTVTTPVYNGIQGHPILLNKELIPFIISSESESLRECLKETAKNKLAIDDIGIITDVDTKEDFEKTEKIFRGK